MATLMTRTPAGAFRVGVQLSAPFLVFGLLFNPPGFRCRG
jgi:hypothetical protein